MKDPALRKQVRAVAWDQAQITDASLLFILCADLNSHRKNPVRYWSHAPQPVQDILVPALGAFYEGHPQMMRDEAMRSTALAGMTLMLAAQGLGYQSGPIVGFDPTAVAELIHLPEDHVISFIVVVGGGTVPPWPRGERLSDAEVVIEDRFV
ncbi:MAG: nitroreductase family protein [Verrucomicrobiales bacterium]|nr:nitroreductase family protein [Verrucomicrobiales bacterium]